MGVSCGNISKTGFVFVFQVVNGEWNPNLGPLERELVSKTGPILVNLIAVLKY